MKLIFILVSLLGVRGQLGAVLGENFGETLEAVTKGSLDEGLGLAIRPTAQKYDGRVVIRRASVADAKYYTNVAGAAFCRDQTLTPFTCTPYCRATTNRTPRGSVQVVQTLHDAVSGTKGYVMINRARQEVVVGFAAEKTTNNRVTVLAAHLVPFNVNSPGNNNRDINTGDIKIHGPFYASAMRFAPKLLQGVTLALNRTGYPLTFVGHSIGGEVGFMAMLVTQARLSLPWHRFKYLGYGTVRMGNKEFAKWFNQQDLEATRIVNYNDKLAHFPFKTNEFEHFANELFINKDGSVRACDNSYFDDPNCSLAELDFNFRDPHVIAFDTTFGIAC